MPKDISLSHYSTEQLFQMLKGPQSDDLLKNYPFTMTNEMLFSSELFKKLKEANVSIEEIASQAMVSRAYMYQISNGTRLPGRDIVIKLSLCLHLTLEETQRLLRCAQRGELYPRVRRDGVIIRCLGQKKGLFETNDELVSRGENPL